MAEPELDSATKKVKRLSIWVTAFILIITALGVGLKVTVSAADKILFYHSLPATIKAIQVTTATILDVVCENHKSSKCPD